MFGECHAHIFMNAYNYRKACQLHQLQPEESDIRRHLRAYQKAGVSFVRDGGDRYGASLLARRLAGEYGITYLTPGYAIHRRGAYGKVVGYSYETMREYRMLVEYLVQNQGDFVKIMTSGIMDFDTDGSITGELLPFAEVRELVNIAHAYGKKVMSHTNTARGVIEAVEAGVDSIEHGNYQDMESIACMAEHPVVWVPTIVTVRNLIGGGRFSDAILWKIAQTQRVALQAAYHAGVNIALGSDAGAYMVPHGQGICDEYREVTKILGETPEVLERLRQGEEKIRLFGKTS